MAETNEFLITALSEKDLQNLRTVLDDDLGSSNQIGKPRTEQRGANPPFDGDADIWQPTTAEGEPCVLVFNETGSVHASGIDVNTKLGKLLTELQKIHGYKEE